MAPLSSQAEGAWHQLRKRGDLDAATDLGHAPGGGAAGGRRVVFGTSCGCFSYVGPTFDQR